MVGFVGAALRLCSGPEKSYALQLALLARAHQCDHGTLSISHFLFCSLAQGRSDNENDIDNFVIEHTLNGVKIVSSAIGLKARVGTVRLGVCLLHKRR